MCGNWANASTVQTVFLRRSQARGSYAVKPVEHRELRETRQYVFDGRVEGNLPPLVRIIGARPLDRPWLGKKEMRKTVFVRGLARPVALRQPPRCAGFHQR